MYATDVMDDLFYEEADGLSEMDYDDDFEDEYDDDFEDAFEAYDDFEDDYDAFEAYDDFEDDYDAFDYIVAEALGTDDLDEFWGKLVKGIKLLKKHVGPKIRKVAGRVGKKILGKKRYKKFKRSKFGKVWRWVNKKALGADEFVDEFEELDELVDYIDDLEELDAAAPVIAGLAIRKTIPGVSRLPKSKRIKLVKKVKNSTKMLGRRRGVKATKAMPKVVQVAKAVSNKTGQPVTKTIPKTTAKVAKSPTTTRRLASKVKKVAKMKRMMKGARKPYPYPMMRGSKYRCHVCGNVSVRC
ncbi:hypothetical protein [Acaryochloris sp. IP29b_bin.148]|uniref:hypothetical protein n=1 Tax=Acaryochloris sp. IP29b_bin.148 TaxID=2969218 RepID=UPI00262586EB|nr:hypothetical protein [Acaryochloris sp. IP29b_bin.148]